MDFTAQLGVMHELPQRHWPLLEGHSIVVASADRVLISGLVHSLDGIGSLVGPPAPKQKHSPAFATQPLIC